MVFNAVRGLLRSPILDLDEGGLRLEKNGVRSYVPFATLTEAKLVRVLGRVSLLVRHASGSWRRFALRHLTPSSVLAAVLTGIEAERDSGRPRAPDLARSDRVIERWLADIDALMSGSAYRSAPLAPHDLAKVVASESSPIDERAAAAYALLTQGELADVVTVARTLRGDPPPLFLALVACAPGGTTLVPPDVVAEIVPYLGDADREAVLAKAVPPLDEAPRARAQEAIQVVLDEEAAAIAAGGAGGKRRLRLHGGGMDPMIGRTWAY